MSNLMSDAVMGGGDVIALVDPSRWNFPNAPQLAYANGHADALAASTPVGGWEDISTAPKRWLVERTGTNGVICWSAYEHELQARNVAKEEAPSWASITVTPLYAAPPPPSVSIDKGSRPQEAVPTEGHDAAVVADYGPVISLETRGPAEDARRQREAEDHYHGARRNFNRIRDDGSLPDDTQPGTPQGVNQTILPQTEKGS